MTTATPETTRGQHGAKTPTDGGLSVVPVQTRSERFRSFDVADFAHVTGREAVWKLTPVDRIEALLHGDLDGSRYDYTASEAPGITLSWIPRSDPRIGLAGIPEERGSAAAWSAFEEALLIEVTGEESKVISITRRDLGTSALAAHTVISAAPFSRGLVILENFGTAELSENVEIVVGEQAELTVVTSQEWADGAHHLASHFATIGRNATLRHIVISLGGDVVRINPSTHLNTEGGRVDAFGAYFADAGQHLEQHVYVNHDAPHTTSRVTYKGALQGNGAHSVWIGDVLIRQTATATDSYEQNRNLVLSDGTRADSVPNLEIETGDITGAGHASATGRFDDEQLFYLQSRGIREEEARRLVVKGFLLEVIQKIGNSILETRLNDAVEESLNKSHELAQGAR
ncbi:Fe-S cluster assembly protein SufD [Klugiella xanthotipulae]|uniref:Iron-regulated ABC transporter permease protein SufD n=1 Tax=Klugiella xanthotipulae TaxID=244735 RepID=A0A543HSP6_9MICO|nr:Fe-S cluster assembly protein SufD [Klugiella xanthotipulae]TQM61361.1 iron-regulated ABC transporter permease protein SufD [Klugiella xanthotipulae]